MNCTVPAAVINDSILVEASYFSIAPPTRNVVGAEGADWMSPIDVVASIRGGAVACLELPTLQATAAGGDFKPRAGGSAALQSESSEIHSDLHDPEPIAMNARRRHNRHTVAEWRRPCR